jgi:hypothetical protein
MMSLRHNEFYTIFTAENINYMGYKLIHFLEVRAALRYGSGSDQMIQLLAAPAPQHFLQTIYTFLPAHTN